MAQSNLLAFLAHYTPQERMDFLSATLKILPTKTPEDRSNCIKWCREGLTIVKKEECPALWADLHVYLANNLVKSSHGSERDNLEMAIGHYGQALTVCSRLTDPQTWSSTHYSLGVAHIDRICGDHANNLEQAITHFNQALTVYTYEGTPEQWARTHHSLGVAYGDRIFGVRKDNLERSIGHFNQALTVYTYEANPDLWAGAQHCLGVAYCDRVVGLRVDNLEQAITHYHEALRARRSSPEDSAKTKRCLGEAYIHRIRGEHADNLEQAILWFKEALHKRTRGAKSREWAHTQHHLGAAYLKRLRGERAYNLDQAIGHFKHALEVRTRRASPQEWAETQHNLAVVYLKSKRIGDEQGHNLEQAIALFNEVLQVRTRELNPAGWAETHQMLAIAYVQRLLGNGADNLEEAIAHGYEAQAVLTCDVNPVAWAEIQLTMGNAYGDRRLRGKRPGNVDKAITRYNQALDVYTLEHFPHGFQRVQQNLGSLHFNEGNWCAALAAYQDAMRAERVLLAGAYTEAGQQALVAETAELYTRTAYALLKLGHIGEALAQLEMGKTRLLSQVLALDEVNLNALSDSQQVSVSRLRQSIRSLKNEMRLAPSSPRSDERTLARALGQHWTELLNLIEQIRATNPDFMPEGLMLSDVLSLIPAATALVAPLVTCQGSAVFVVPTGLQSVGSEHVLWLDEFKDTNLKELLGSIEEAHLRGWLGAYFNAPTNLTAWFGAIESTGQALQNSLMAPIAERLATLNITHVLLMPQGGLGLLPLHAAWHEVDGIRRYFVDDYTVTYLPSAYAYKVSLERMTDTQRNGRSLVAVINPTQDLPFTRAEGEQVAGLFDRNMATVLSGANATPEVVMKQAMAGYIHFSCHGFYRWDDPMQSGLVLALREPLTMAKIIGRLNLDKTRVVTLSACETGITDIRQAPDEYLGLPAGFLQAGAPAVVSTLWAVNDLSTMLLMERFYQLHLREGRDLPVALRHAQIWLRDVTAGELARRFADEEEDALLSLTRTSIRAASDYFTRFTNLDPKEKPFAHPYYWAPFTFSGA